MMSDLANDIDRYEGGAMTEEETTAFFQSLINSGLAYQMAPHYRHTALALIEAGECRP